MRRSTIILVLAALGASLIAGCGSTQPGEQVSASTGGSALKQTARKVANKAASHSRASQSETKPSCSHKQLTHGLSVKLTNEGGNFLITACNVGHETVAKWMLYVHGELLGAGQSTAPVMPTSTPSGEVQDGGSAGKAIRRMVINGFAPGDTKTMQVNYPGSLVSGHGQVTAQVIILGPGATSQFTGLTRRFSRGKSVDVLAGS